MRRHRETLFACALLAACVLRGPAAETPANPSVRYIQRTMRLMEESTDAKPSEVRLLFYGQSLVEQGWHKHVVETLHARYPTVKFTVKNLAIGGFTSEILVRTAESDLYPEYADLVFFQDYGPTELVRTMIERLRARTTSEIVLWTSHLHAQDTVEVGLAESDTRSRELKRIAADTHCMMVPLRRKWAEAVVAQFGGNVRGPLSDGCHLSEKTGAFRLYAKILTDELVRLPDAPPDAMSGTVATVPFPRYATNETGAIVFPFTGNRVVAETGDFRGYYNSSPCKVLLDGREMRGMKELFLHTRPSGLVSWMPIVLRVEAETLPVEETWTLTFLKGTDPLGSPIRYRVDGTVTGFDGEGTNFQDFVSKSGRVKIRASDFHVWQYDYFVKKANRRWLCAKPGQWTCWNTVRQFNDRLPTYSQGHEKIVLVTGIANGPHTLTFVPAIPARKPDICRLTVHRPYLAHDIPPTELEKRAAAHREPVHPEFNPTAVR